MDLARAVALTRDFYAWEKRGRGWQTWPEPVELEPPYRPFALRTTPVVVLDDGRRATVFSRLRDVMLGRRTSASATAPAIEEEPEDEPALFYGSDETVEMQLVLPPETKVTPHQAEAFLLSLTACTEPVSFEVLATGMDITLRFACSAEDAAFLRHELETAFPGVVLREPALALADAFHGAAGIAISAVEFGLESECMCPLRVPEKWQDADPFASILAAGSLLEDDEVAVLQVLFAPTRAPWAEEMLRAVKTPSGDSFFVDAPDMVRHAEKKTSRPLFAVAMRVGILAESHSRSRAALRAFAGALAAFTDPASNALVPLEADAYEESELLHHILTRTTRRSGMLLNSQELASLVHPPAPSVVGEKLRRESRRTRLAPPHLEGHALVLGESRHQGKVRTVSLPPDIRLRHQHLIGATGTGKSTLLLNLICQGCENGEGLAVFDPHGDLIEDILARIPEKRHGDVVLIDPSDEDAVIGFNPLHAHSDIERTLIASDTVAAFQRLSTSWGDQMSTVLGNAVLALLESDRGGTLADLRRFLLEKDFREAFLRSVHDTDIRDYWQREYPLVSGRPHASVLARLNALLRPKSIRAMLSAREHTLDVATLMDEGRIVLVKLSQGLMGEENSSLLGALLVGKFQQLALARQARGRESRRPFYIYLDEFHHFALPSLTTLLSGGRKYGVGITLAHQETRQVASENPALLSAVLANAGTRICFRVGDEDAKRLEDGFVNFSAMDLQNLGVGEAIVRVERGDADFSLLTRPSPPSTADEDAVRVQVAEMSRALYGTPVLRDPVEVRDEPEPAPPTPTHSTAPAPPKRAVPRAAHPVPEVPLRGRGGSQHRYLQELVRRWGEANGWRVSIEKVVLDGLGIVDVALERDDISVACEIASTTTDEHEVQNIQKCLAAGFTRVAVVSVEKARHGKLVKALSAALPNEPRVTVLTPEDLFDFLGGLNTAPPQEKTVHGYKVKVSTARDDGARSRSVAGVIVGALKRLRG